MSSKLNCFTIRDANKAVLEVSKKKPKARGRYAKFIPEQQAMIAQYASMNGIVSAVEHFSKELDVNLKESTVRTWKAKYLAEVRLRKKADDGTPLSVTSLPQKKRGRPLMLGESLDTQLFVKEVGLLQQQ